MMRVYIAGPIKGVPDGNRSAFAERADQLRAGGYEPLNPWDLSPDGHPGPCIGDEIGQPHRYGCYLRADIAEMMFCDGITMLRGWRNSKGAVTEYQVATALGLELVEL